MEIKIASTQDVPLETMMGIKNGDKTILVANLSGKYYAIGNKCKHRGCTLSEGTFNGEKVICPCHGSTFDIRTGEVLRGPAKKPEPSYKLRIDGDQILASI